MNRLSRRAVVSALTVAPIAMPAIIRAQSTSKPVKIGLLSDMGGPYRDVGGPGNRVATELAIEDFGGSVLGKRVELVSGGVGSYLSVGRVGLLGWVGRCPTAIA